MSDNQFSSISQNNYIAEAPSYSLQNFPFNLMLANNQEL